MASENRGFCKTGEGDFRKIGGRAERLRAFFFFRVGKHQKRGEKGEDQEAFLRERNQEGTGKNSLESAVWEIGMQKSTIRYPPLFLFKIHEEEEEEEG